MYCHGVRDDETLRITMPGFGAEFVSYWETRIPAADVVWQRAADAPALRPL